jgi:hypothetical protein
MLMGWYASDTARASVRDQLAPLEKLGRARADTATRTLAAYLHEQGSIIKTAQRLHLYRNAVANRIHGITELAGRGFRGPRPAARPPARLPRAPAGLTVPGAGPAGSTLSTYASRCSGFPLRFIVASAAGAVFITNGRRAGR